MDPAKFNASKTGDLAPITFPGPPPIEDWVFRPAMLPPANWSFPVELFPLLLEAQDELGRLDGIGYYLPNVDVLLRPLQSREVYSSSRLEGTVPEVNAVEQLLLYEQPDNDADAQNEREQEWVELRKYRQAISAGLEALQSRPLSLVIIKDMHKILLDGTRGHNKSPGEFRRISISVNGRRYNPPEANYLVDLLDNLQTYINVSIGGDKTPDLVKAFISHYQFEAIHPFLDGNGRIGRSLLALTIYKLLKHKLPWLYMSVFFHRKKEEYFRKLFNVSATGSWTEWVEFCLRGTILQARDSISRCAKLIELRRKYLERVEHDCGPRTGSIIESLFSSPFVRIAELSKRFNIHYDTAKSDVDHLVDKKILFFLEGLKPKTYYCPEVFRTTYDDSDYNEDKPVESATFSTVSQPPSGQSPAAPAS